MFNIADKVKLIKGGRTRYGPKHTAYNSIYGIITSDIVNYHDQWCIIDWYLEGGAVVGNQNAYKVDGDEYDTEIELYFSYNMEEIEDNLDKIELCLKKEIT